MAEKETRPDPFAEGKGRIDEVDQSKGFFPPNVPHPPGAEIRPPGSIGGGPYEESGRGGTGVSIGQPTAGGASVDKPPGEAGKSGEEPGQTKETEPAGVLPPHGHRGRNA
jgi:hypothetical protein